MSDYKFKLMLVGVIATLTAVIIVGLAFFLPVKNSSNEEKIDKRKPVNRIEKIAEGFRSRNEQ